MMVGQAVRRWNDGKTARQCRALRAVRDVSEFLDVGSTVTKPHTDMNAQTASQILCLKSQTIAQRDRDCGVLKYENEVADGRYAHYVPYLMLLMLCPRPPEDSPGLITI